MKYTCFNRILSVLTLVSGIILVLPAQMSAQERSFTVVSSNVMAQGPYEESVRRLFEDQPVDVKEGLRPADVVARDERNNRLKIFLRECENPDLVAVQEWDRAWNLEGTDFVPVADSFVEQSGGHGVCVLHKPASRLIVDRVIRGDRYTCTLNRVRNVQGGHRVGCISMHIPLSVTAHQRPDEFIGRIIATLQSAPDIDDWVVMGDWNVDMSSEENRAWLQGVLERLHDVTGGKRWKNAASAWYGADEWYRRSTAAGSKVIDLVLYTAGLRLERFFINASGGLLKKRPVELDSRPSATRWFSDHSALEAMFSVKPKRLAAQATCALSASAAAEGAVEDDAAQEEYLREKAARRAAKVAQRRHLREERERLEVEEARVAAEQESLQVARAAARAAAKAQRDAQAREEAERRLAVQRVVEGRVTENFEGLMSVPALLGARSLEQIRFFIDKILPLLTGLYREFPEARGSFVMPCDVVRVMHRALFDAARSGAPGRVITDLLACGADPNAEYTWDLVLYDRDENLNPVKRSLQDRWTPLMIATYEGHAEAVRLLVAHDRIEINRVSPYYHYSAYMIAAVRHPELKPTFEVHPKLLRWRCSRAAFSALMLDMLEGRGVECGVVSASSPVGHRLACSFEEAASVLEQHTGGWKWDDAAVKRFFLAARLILTNPQQVQSSQGQSFPLVLMDRSYNADSVYGHANVRSWPCLFFALGWSAVCGQQDSLRVFKEFFSWGATLDACSLEIGVEMRGRARLFQQNAAAGGVLPVRSGVASIATQEVHSRRDLYTVSSSTPINIHIRPLVIAAVQRCEKDALPYVAYLLRMGANPNIPVLSSGVASKELVDSVEGVIREMPSQERRYFRDVTYLALVRSLACGRCPLAMRPFFRSSESLLIAMINSIDDPHVVCMAVKLVMEYARVPVDINYQHGYDGNTAVHVAVIKERIDAVKMLLLYGADATIENNQGLTPQKLASSLCRGSRSSGGSGAAAAGGGSQSNGDTCGSCQFCAMAKTIEQHTEALEHPDGGKKAQWWDAGRAFMEGLDIRGLGEDA